MHSKLSSALCSSHQNVGGSRRCLCCMKLAVHISRAWVHDNDTLFWIVAQMALEKAFVQRLVAAGRVVVHDTTCYGQRECGPGDHDQSCHWGTDGKYYCLRCAFVTQLPCICACTSCMHDMNPVPIAFPMLLHATLLGVPAALCSGADASFVVFIVEPEGKPPIGA